MLNRYELLVAKEESERVDTLRYSWQKLQSLAVSIDVHKPKVLAFISPRHFTNSSLQVQDSNFFSGFEEMTFPHSCAN